MHPTVAKLVAKKQTMMLLRKHAIPRSVDLAAVVDFVVSAQSRARRIKISTVVAIADDVATAPRARADGAPYPFLARECDS